MLAQQILTTEITEVAGVLFGGSGIATGTLAASHVLQVAAASSAKV